MWSLPRQEKGGALRVGIVGGGITGLALTHALARRGIESVLFEASELPGGIIRTLHEGGRVLEVGPQRTRLVPGVRKLVEELGLGDRVLEAAAGAELHVWARGKLRRVPSKPGGLLTGDLLSTSGRIRAAVEPLTAGLRMGESVAGYFRRKVGDEAYRTLFGPLISATFASDPDKMPAARALPMILQPLGVRRSLLAAAARWSSDGSARACTFRGGMSELPLALAQRHADRVRLGTKVLSIETDGSALRVDVRGPVSSESIRLGEVVLTVPPTEAARLLRSVAPDASARLGQLRTNEVSVVPLQVESAPTGFGFQVAFGERWRTRGVTWNASLFGRTGICTAYLGGGLDPEVAGWSDGRVGRLAAREYTSIHGVEAWPLAVARPRLPAYDDSWSSLDDLVLPAGIRLAANYMGRLGISARIAQAEAVADALVD